MTIAKLCDYCGNKIGDDSKDAVLIYYINGKNYDFCDDKCFSFYFSRVNYKEEPLEINTVAKCDGCKKEKTIRYIDVGEHLHNYCSVSCLVDGHLKEREFSVVVQ